MDQQKVQKCSHGYIQILTNRFLVLIIFRYGRVNFVLASRLELLKEVQRLQVSAPRCSFDSCASSPLFLINYSDFSMRRLTLNCDAPFFPPATVTSWREFSRAWCHALLVSLKQGPKFLRQFHR